MDHRALLARLPAETRARLTARRDLPGLGHLAAHLALIAALGAPIALALPFWPLALLPYGIALTFLFTLEHECTHATPFRSRALNEATGHAIGALLLLPFL